MIFSKHGKFWHDWARTTKAALVLIPSCLVVAWVYISSLQSALGNLDREASQRIEYLALDLSIQLARYESLPYVIAQQPEIIQALSDPNKANLAGVNNYLTRVQITAQADVIFLLNENGVTIATSSILATPEEIGSVHALRPYFMDAMKEGSARYFATGATFDQPGYYLSQRVSFRESTGKKPPKNGAIVVKVSLGDFEATWRRSGESILLMDDYGIVFLATQHEWKYRPIAYMRPGVYDTVSSSGTYGSNLSNLPILNRSSIQQLIRTGSELGTLRKGIAVELNETGGPTYQAHATHITAKGWTLVRLANRQSAINYSLVVTSLAALVLTLAWLAFFYFRLRKKRLNELQQSRQALQQAQEELESRIAERTQELQLRIAHLKQTEQVLRKTQDEMIQAGKMASIGKMAAGITHEISQPLTAIRTLSENALRLSHLERREEARDNLKKIVELCERAAHIVSELKGFSRKTDARLSRVDLNESVRRALAIIHTNQQARLCRIDLNLTGTALYVRADLIRLEQLVINLVMNAIDAMRGLDSCLVVITTYSQGKEAVLTVQDIGVGISEQELGQIFEPFFTTKKNSDSLGLGLSICAAIVQSFSGKIQVTNRPDGGARFEVILPLSDHNE